LLNAAVDSVRRAEQGHEAELKKTRYVWLKNRDNLKHEQAQQLVTFVLSRQNLKTVRAYHIKTNFQELWDQPAQAAECFLKEWYFWATHSRLEPMIDAARTIKRHWDGVLRWFHTQLNNGILEGIAGLVQAVRARARGYRNIDNFITMIYIVAGKLKFDLPT